MCKREKERERVGERREKREGKISRTGARDTSDNISKHARTGTWRVRTLTFEFNDRHTINEKAYHISYPYNEGRQKEEEWSGRRYAQEADDRPVSS